MLRDLLFLVGRLLLGQRTINRIAINRVVKAARNRPHPWSTRFDDYICWTGLTDKTWFARLLPAAPPPAAEGIGTSHPPVEELIKLFPAPPGAQVPCDKSTCLFPAFAQYLTDGFLRTKLHNDPPGDQVPPQQENRRRTTTNHEIDLSPLYGRTEAQTRVLRSMSGGRLKSQVLGGEEYPPYLYGADGRIKDEFCADGLLVLDEPLGVDKDTAGRATLFAAGGDRANASVLVSTINTLFLREHNRLAGELEQRNRGWSDERLFETARNILIVKFIRIVVNEYINHISSAPFRFEADPSVCWKADWNRPNWMTVEFTLLYRWHSLVPENLQWAGQPVPTHTTLLNNALLTAGGLANAMVQISASPAARMGLGNFAHALTEAERRGIKQGRENRVQGYNAYCREMGLGPKASFTALVGTAYHPDERNRLRELAANLEELYGTIDNLEFYVGLFAEPRTRNSPVPELVLAMVAMDAFSQALPNPLLSQHVWGNEANRHLAFTGFGVAEIERTNSLRDLLRFNCPDLDDSFVGMTRPGWRRR